MRSVGDLMLFSCIGSEDLSILQSAPPFGIREVRQNLEEKKNPAGFFGNLSGFSEP
jgi:hypothetical protein